MSHVGVPEDASLEAAASAAGAYPIVVVAGGGGLSMCADSFLPIVRPTQYEHVSVCAATTGVMSNPQSGHEKSPESALGSQPSR